MASEKAAWSPGQTPKHLQATLACLIWSQEAASPHCLGVEERGAKLTNPPFTPVFASVLLLVLRQILGSEHRLTVLS